MSEPEEPSDLALGYSARIVAHETLIDLPAEDLMRLSRYEARVLKKTALKNGYSFNHLPAASKYWLTRP